MTNILQK